MVIVSAIREKGVQYQLGVRYKAAQLSTGAEARLERYSGETQEHLGRMPNPEVMATGLKLCAAAVIHLVAARIEEVLTPEEELRQHEADLGGAQNAS